MGVVKLQHVFEEGYLPAIMRVSPRAIVIDITVRTVSSECISLVDVHNSECYFVIRLVFKSDVRE